MNSSWENLYRNNKHHSIWPWTDLISEVKKLNIKGKIALELGCGMGANIPFLISEGYTYYGIDSSQTAITHNINCFPNLKDNLIVCDFTRNIPFDNEFDLIFDRASITHNDNKGIQSCIENISKKIKESGYYIGIDWFSKNHSDYGDGIELETGTKTCINSDQFKGTGDIHFFDQEEINHIFHSNNLKVIKMEEKIYQDIQNKENIRKRASFNFVAIKQ